MKDKHSLHSLQIITTAVEADHGYILQLFAEMFMTSLEWCASCDPFEMVFLNLFLQLIQIWLIFQQHTLECLLGYWSKAISGTNADKSHIPISQMFGIVGKVTI